MKYLFALLIFASTARAQNASLMEDLVPGLTLKQVGEIMSDVPLEHRDTVWEGTLKPNIRLLRYAYIDLYGLAGVVIVSFDRKGKAEVASWQRGNLLEYMKQEGFYERVSLDELDKSTDKADFFTVSEEISKWLGKHTEIDLDDAGIIHVWKSKKSKVRNSLNKSANGMYFMRSKAD